MGVYLINVHLTGVHLMGVHLTGVHLMGVYLMTMPLPCPELAKTSARAKAVTISTETIHAGAGGKSFKSRSGMSE
jgi:hypothetical protein